MSNPNIGYGTCIRPVARDPARQFYRLGLSANAAGLSVYLMPFADRSYLPGAYAARIGRAKVTGYCISFRTLGNIDRQVLEAALHDAARH